MNARKGYDTLVAALAKIADLPWESRIAGTLDRDLPRKLKEAFGKHPRVASVEKVTISAPNHVRVDVVLY